MAWCIWRQGAGFCSAPRPRLFECCVLSFVLLLAVQSLVGNSGLRFFLLLFCLDIEINCKVRDLTVLVVRYRRLAHLRQGTTAWRFWRLSTAVACGVHLIVALAF